MGRFFTQLPLYRGDKEIRISGPVGLRLTVDYDDVNHEWVRGEVKHMINVLNMWYDTEDFDAHSNPE